MEAKVSDLFRYYYRGLLTTREWRVLGDLDYYGDCFAHGEMSDAGVTKRKAKCNICLGERPAGQMRKFWLKRRRPPTDYDSGHRHFCGDCLARMGVHAFIIARESVPVTTL